MRRLRTSREYFPLLINSIHPHLALSERRESYANDFFAHINS